MDGAQTIISILSGGLAGAGVSALTNRIFHWRTLRTQFHPKLHNIMGEYVLRFSKPEGQYWTGTVGKVPLPDNEAFVGHRTEFFFDLPKYNELREARQLRRAMMKIFNSDRLPDGSDFKINLLPEYKAILKCLNIVERKLKL